jgi:hypothetical protein
MHPRTRLRALALTLAVAIFQLVAPVPTAAQTAGDVLREALAPLGPDLVTTGRLHDRALPLAGLRALDGRPEAPPLTPLRFGQALAELRQAAVTPQAWPAAWPDAAALRRRANAADQRLVEIALFDLAYQTLSPDALDRGLLLLQTDPAEPARFLPSPTATTAGLLREHRATAATALDPVTHHGADLRFVLPGDLLLADRPTLIAIDLDDGAGLRALTPDHPLQARYTATGRKEVRLRLTDPAGEVRWTGFTLDVVALDTPPPTEVWPLTASIPYDGSAAAGEAFVYLADGHAEVTSPVLVVEGFDLDDSYDWPELYALLNQENLLEDLRAAGHDAVVLNFDSATQPIQRNAYLLVELMHTLADLLPAGTTYPVVGASMGGLVARHALAWLEANEGSHGCDLFISFDAPHLGAGIPLGLQLWVDFFAGESGEAAFLLDRLNTPAARQMLLYHHTALSGESAAPDPLFVQFQADLAALGDWPAQPRLVAVVNGSGAGLDQGFDPGDQLVVYEYESFLVDLIGNIWSVPDGGPQLVFHGLIDLIWPLPDIERLVTVTGTQPWDGAPGGFRASQAQLDTTSVEYGDIIALHDAHAFIPTVSAVALVGADPFADLGDLAGAAPFDAVFLPAANEEHVAITAASKAWLLDEILGTATGVDPGAQPVPVALQLHGAVPNPFNPSNEIAFALPADGPARLWIADLRGRRLRSLVDGPLAAGRHTAVWDGRRHDGGAVASGVYLAVLEHATGRAARRLTLVR